MTNKYAEHMKAKRALLKQLRNDGRMLYEVRKQHKAAVDLVKKLTEESIPSYEAMLPTAEKALLQKRNRFNRKFGETIEQREKIEQILKLQDKIEAAEKSVYFDKAKAARKAKKNKK